LTFIIVLLMSLTPTAGVAQSPPQEESMTHKEKMSAGQAGAPAALQAGGLRPKVRLPLKHDVSPPLAAIKPIPPEPAKALREIPLFPLPKAKPGEAKGGTLGPFLQNRPGTASMPSPIQNFEGLNNVNGVLPPDTNGDVGPNHYLQWVNLSFAIWDKTGTLLYGPAVGNTLWAGFGGICEAYNDSDPIALSPV